MPSGKGQRLIILHAGGVDGWVEVADLVFRSKTNSTDYHDEMNSKHYMEWMTQQLLPQLEGVSIHWTGLLDWNTGLDYWTDL